MKSRGGQGKPKNAASKKTDAARPEHRQLVQTPKTEQELAEARAKTNQARREYDRARSQIPERREYPRLREQESRKQAKELGQCRDCPKPAKPGQTRCPTCAEKRRESRRRNNAKRRAAAT